MLMIKIGQMKGFQAVLGKAKEKSNYIFERKSCAKNLNATRNITLQLLKRRD